MVKATGETDMPTKKKKKKKLDRAKWCGEWGTILYGNPKGALALKIEVSLGKKIYRSDNETSFQMCIFTTNCDL